MSLEDRFDIDSPIYVGQVATSYPAIQRQLDRRVLLKVLHSHLAEDTELVERFRREGRAIAQIDHPNVVRVFDCAQEDGVPYLVIEWIDGGTIKDRLKDGPLAADEIVKLARETLSGLSAVHDAGLLHRDIKPDNILMGVDGRIRLADFSLAGFRQSPGMTAHGAIVGSPAYMAPEVAGGSPATRQSDLYSLGIVLLEALTGSNPYAADDPLVSLDLVLRKEPPRLANRPAVDSGLARLVDALLQRESDNRPQDANAAAALLDSETASMPPETSRKWRLVPISLVSILLLVFLLWIWTSRSNDSEPAETTLTPELFVTEAPVEEMDFSVEDDTAVVISDITPPATVVASLGGTAVRSKPTPRIEPGHLMVIAKPWASVRIDGKDLGVTPFGVLDLDPGSHELSLTHDLYPTIIRRLHILPGTVDTLLIDLRAEASQMDITVNPWGYLWIDGDSIGILPRREPVWSAPGDHLIEIRHPKHEILRDSITTSAGEIYSFRYNLASGTKIAPISND